MDRDLLKGFLDRGLSLEAIGQLENRHPSTVGYWLAKHGLVPTGRAKHARRGGLSREVLEPLIKAGHSQREIATTLGVSQATVRYWLERHELRTERRHRVHPDNLLARVQLTCPHHGETTFFRRSDSGYRCTKCNQAAVVKRRRQLKRILVEEAGGACVICGYDKCLRNLHFHHRDPKEKSFALSGRGYSRSLEKLREEAKKCALLCSNCHYEVEEGLTTLP